MKTFIVILFIRKTIFTNTDTDQIVLDRNANKSAVRTLLISTSCDIMTCMNGNGKCKLSIMSAYRILLNLNLLIIISQSLMGDTVFSIQQLVTRTQFYSLAELLIES